MHLYSLTSSKVIDEKIHVLRDLGLAPAIVFHSSHSVDEIVTTLKYANEFAAPAIAHLPFRDIQLDEDGPHRKTSTDRLIDAGLRAVDAGAARLLMHSFLPYRASQAPPQVVDAMQYIAERLRPHAQIVIENTFETIPDAFTDLLEHIDAQAALDVPRLVWRGSTPTRWWDAIGHRVAALHAYGSDGEDHHGPLRNQDSPWLRQVYDYASDIDVLLDVPRSDLAASKDAVLDVLRR
jgi:sugar phosphate isomerase/epimerase